MKFLSLFSGIEAATVAWAPLGWDCVGVAEIEKFPAAVLAHHYPDVPNLGDVTKITKQDVERLGPIDLVCGGFPCQDLSVAGQRKGLKNVDGSATRSGLFFDAMRIAEWANPRWLFIENVPGMFSSNQGRDFAAVVGEMAGCEFDVPREGWRNAGVVAGPKGLVEWTVLDAQYHGLAQRRKRVFLVRDSGDWSNRAPLFLEQYRLCGHPAPSREAGQSAARGVEIGPSGGCYSDLSPTLNPTAVAIGLDQELNGRYELAGTLQRKGEGGFEGSVMTPDLQVRRLTPTEAEKLQGFEPGYTAIPWRKKPADQCPDGPRYKALGNSWAVPCARWIGKRIKAEVERTA